MNTYTITNRISGQYLGAYEARDEYHALDQLAADAGYGDWTHQCEMLGEGMDEDYDPRSEFIIEELPRTIEDDDIMPSYPAC